MKNQLKESYEGSSRSEVSPSSSVIEIVLEIPECPISVNRWLGKRFAKHNEVKRWEKNIACAMLEYFTGAGTAKNLTQATTLPIPPVSQFQMRWSTLASLAMTKISRRKPRKGWTRIKLTFKKNQIPLLDKISAKW